MKTMMVGYTIGLGGVYDGKRIVRTVECVADPIPFEQARAHLELGGSIVAMRGGVFYGRIATELFMSPVELWEDVKWHVLVREL